MKYLILLSLSFFSIQGHAIELILNGVTYKIDGYTIDKNGQRIIVNDPKIVFVKGGETVKTNKRRPAKVIRVRRKSIRSFIDDLSNEVENTGRSKSKGYQ